MHHTNAPSLPPCTPSETGKRKGKAKARKLVVQDKLLVKEKWRKKEKERKKQVLQRQFLTVSHGSNNV